MGLLLGGTNGTTTSFPRRTAGLSTQTRSQRPVLWVFWWWCAGVLIAKWPAKWPSNCFYQRSENSSDVTVQTTECAARVIYS